MPKLCKIGTEGFWKLTRNVGSGFRLVPFSTHLTSIALNGGRIDGPQIDIEIMAKRWQIEQNFVLRGIGKSWVGVWTFDW